MSQSSLTDRDTTSNPLLSNNKVTLWSEYTDFTSDSSSFISNPEGFIKAERETVSDQEFVAESDASDLNSNREINNEYSSERDIHSFSSNTSEQGNLGEISESEVLDCFANLSLGYSETYSKNDTQVMKYNLDKISKAEGLDCYTNSMLEDPETYYKHHDTVDIKTNLDEISISKELGSFAKSSIADPDTYSKHNDISDLKSDSDELSKSKVLECITKTSIEDPETYCKHNTPDIKTDLDEIQKSEELDIFTKSSIEELETHSKIDETPNEKSNLDEIIESEVLDSFAKLSLEHCETLSKQDDFADMTPNLDESSKLEELESIGQSSLEDSETDLQNDVTPEIKSNIAIYPDAHPENKTPSSHTKKLDLQLSHEHLIHHTRLKSSVTSISKVHNEGLLRKNTLYKWPKTKSEFHNCSNFSDDIKSPFDQDFDIDEFQVTEKRQERSPWRDFRSTLPQKQNIQQASFLSRKNVPNSGTGIASAEKIEDLSKQLINCKIQLKLYEKFLQDLCDKQSVEVADVTTFQSHLIHTSTSPESSESVPQIPEKAYTEKDSKDMAALVEDLYASLEDSQTKWRDADHKFFELNKKITDFSKGAIDILRETGVGVVNVDNKDNLNDAQLCLDHVLSVLKQSVARSDTEKQQFTGLQSVSEGLFHECSDYPKREAPSRELHEVSVLENNVDQKLQEYQDMIDRLKKEVNELKAQSRMSSVSEVSDNTYFSSESRDKGKQSLLQKEFERLQVSHHDLIDEHHRYKSSSERTLISLKVHVEQLEKENLSLKSKSSGMTNLEHELQDSIEKQRILSAKKIKLSYEVEALKQDKLALRKSLDRLTERLAVSSENNGASIEALRKKSQHAFDLVDRILEVDMRQFESLLNSFNKIADDASLNDPRQKIGAISTLNSGSVLDLQHDEIHSVEQAHRSIHNFFSRAVEVIVNDHIRLLLKDNERKCLYDKKVTELMKHISELKEQNKQLSERPEFMSSPRSKLRIEELTNRWKSEREARILENRQAKKRLYELEQGQKI